MGDRLIDMEGVGPAYAATLAEHGLATTDDLLSRGARPAGRAALAAETGISGELILEWVNHADLFRIRGVAGQFADLLEEAGVDTVVELARRNPENLAAALAETNTAKNLANRVPSAGEVADWVAQAKELPRAVFYDDAVADESSPAAPAAAAADVAPQPSPEPAPDAVPVSPMAAQPQEDVPARDVPPAAVEAAPAPVREAVATPAVAPPAGSWLTRLFDRIRGR